MRATTRAAVGCLTSAALAAAAAPLAAQRGAGTGGAAALQLDAGARAAALGGAYAGADDADVLFYNPAGSAALRAGASLSFQRHVEDVTFATVAVARRAGPATLGVALALLDAGSVAVLEPDPAYGGERGAPTGATASAGESATRLTLALPVGDRLRLGAAAGWASTTVAGASRSAAFGDVGVQLALARVTLGASLRSLGGSLTGDGTPAPLPREGRLGGMLELPRVGRLEGRVAADWVRDLAGSGGGLAGGVEAGAAGVTGRVGYRAAGALQGELSVGGGVRVRGVAVDYAWQRWEGFGGVNRIGVRWGR